MFLHNQLIVHLRQVILAESGSSSLEAQTADSRVRPFPTSLHPPSPLDSILFLCLLPNLFLHRFPLGLLFDALHGLVLGLLFNPFLQII